MREWTKVPGRKEFEQVVDWNGATVYGIFAITSWHNRQYGSTGEPGAVPDG